MLTEKTIREVTQNRRLRELENQKKHDKITAVFLFLVSGVLLLIAAVALYVKKTNIEKENKEKLAVVQQTFSALNKIEQDFMYTYVYFDQCGADLVFEETDDGFLIHAVKHPSQVMKVKKKVASLHSKSIPVKIGYDVVAGDEVVLCDPEGMIDVLKIKSVYNKDGNDYLIFDQEVAQLIDQNVDSYVAKTAPIEYLFEPGKKGLDLIRIDGEKEKRIAQNIDSYRIVADSLFKGSGDMVFMIDVKNPQDPLHTTVRVTRKIPIGVSE